MKGYQKITVAVPTDDKQAVRVYVDGERPRKRPKGSMTKSCRRKQKLFSRIRGLTKKGAKKRYEKEQSMLAV